MNSHIPNNIVIKEYYLFYVPVSSIICCAPPEQSGPLSHARYEMVWCWMVETVCMSIVVARTAVRLLERMKKHLQLTKITP